MRIAVNTRFLIANKLEGIGWFTHEVLKRMVRSHPEHEFLFLFDRPFSEDFVFSSNVKPIKIFPPARHPVLWYLWFEHALPYIFKKHKPDIFFSPDGYLSLKTRVPTAMVIHDLAYLHFPDQVPSLVKKYYHHFIPRYLKKAQQIITVSSFVKEDILNHYAIESQKINVACNGAREVFRPLNANEKEKIKTKFSQGKDYFFYLGAVHPRKNVHRLIKAFDIFKKKKEHPIQLLIGGRFAWQTGEVKNAYDSSAYQEDIHFLGYLQEEETPGLMGAASALVYPSNFEGFGIPILEALHCDVPVITSNISSMPEVAGPAGILINPVNTHEIATAMEAIIFDKEKRASLIEAGKEWRGHFSWEKAEKVCFESINKAVESP